MGERRDDDHRTSDRARAELSEFVSSEKTYFFTVYSLHVYKQRTLRPLTWNQNFMYGTTQSLLAGGKVMRSAGEQSEG